MDHFQRYRQILLWPLEVLDGDFGGQVQRLKAVQTEKQHPIWTRVAFLDRGPSSDPNDLYAEFVYFHRFAQRFLYPSKETDLKSLEENALKYPFAIWKREDVKGVRIMPTGGAAEERFDVKRVHFYLFQTQIAILVVEIEADREISRRAALAIQDQFRRAYAPFFYADGKAGLSPEYVMWLNENGLPLDGHSDQETDRQAPIEHKSQKRSHISNYHAFDDFEAWRKAEALRAEHVNNPERLKAELATVYPGESQPPQLERVVVSRTPTKESAGFGGIPVASHWAWLLPEGLKYDYIEDDRIPQMHHFQVEDAHGVTRADMIRMCFADGPSTDQDELPYAREFLSKFDEQRCYDRFWSKDQGLTTRYMCCGYGFTMLTDGGPFAAKILSGHFRHHYFQLGLLAHYHRASLLRFSRRLSEADNNSARRKVRREFAEFTNEHWFREVSNQDQGRELFALWSKQLGNQELFDQVHTESRAVEDIVGSAQMLKLTTSVDVLTRRLLWLALLTLVAAVMTWLVAFADMGANHKPFEDWIAERGWHIGAVFGWTFIALLASGIAWGIWALRKLKE